MSRRRISRSAGPASLQRLPTGKYQQNPNEIFCDSCVIGHFGDLNQPRTSSSHCVKCPVGKYSRPGMLRFGQVCDLCQECGSGSFARGCEDGTNPGTCVTCSVGKIQAGSGCIACPSRMYQDQEGQTECKNCTSCGSGYGRIAVVLGGFAWSVHRVALDAGAPIALRAGFRMKRQPCM